MEENRVDLVLPLTRMWFARIWNGEKTVEYREKKPYWDKRIGSWVNDRLGVIRTVMFQIGYASDGPRMIVDVNHTDVGDCPYEGWSDLYYRLFFLNIRRFHRKDGKLISVEKPERMSERKG